MDREFLSIADISKYLCMKRSTLYLKVKKQEIPFYRFGRLIRFKRIEIDRWTEEFKFEAGDSNLKRAKYSGSISRGCPDIDRIVKKTIDDIKHPKYTYNYGKPDRIKGLGKEVKNGTL